MSRYGVSKSPSSRPLVFLAPPQRLIVRYLEAEPVEITTNHPIVRAAHTAHLASSASASGVGEGASRFSVGERVGVPWLGWTDGTCRFCCSGQENLCDQKTLRREKRT